MITSVFQNSGPENYCCLPNKTVETVSMCTKKLFMTAPFMKRLHKLSCVRNEILLVGYQPTNQPNEKTGLKENRSLSGPTITKVKKKVSKFVLKTCQ